MAVREGFHTITPYLTTPKLDEFLLFLKRAFGAEETLRDRGGGGGLHVEVRIGDSMLMVGEKPGAATTAMLYLYVSDPDAYYRRAVECGAKSLMEPRDLPDGERRAGVSDTAGNVWFFGKPLS